MSARRLSGPDGAMVVIRRAAFSFAIGGWLATVAGAIGAVALRIVDPVPQLPSTFGFGDTALVGFGILGVAFASVGSLLVIRRPRNVIGWLMVFIGMGYALGGFFAAVTFSLSAHPSAFRGLDPAITAWLTVLFTTVGGAVFALGFIFPTGRGHDPTWDRGLRVAAVCSPVMLAIVFLIRPGPLHVFPTIDNPFGIGPDLRPLLGDQVSERVSSMAVLLLPLFVWSLAARYRNAGRTERQQLKWFGLSIAVAIVALAIAGGSATLSDDPPEIGLVLFGFAGAFVPVAIGIAILRHGLYDIDRLISRSLAYLVVTGVLVTTFGVTSLGLSILLGSLAQGQSLAVAASTLIVFALFGPLRRWARSSVDRRFDRSHYDAAVTVEAFTVRLRDDLDLERVEADVLGVVGVTLRPTACGLWIRGRLTSR